MTKSEVGSIKKMVQPPPDASRNVEAPILKKGWRASEQDAKSEKKARFAGAAVKGPRMSVPTPLLTSRITHINSSYDSDDTEANFASAGEVVNDATAKVNKFNPKILTAHHNVTALGYKCLEPPRSTSHAYQGSQLGISPLSSLRLADNIHRPDRLLVTMNIDPLPIFTTSSVPTTPMQSIGGQEEVITAATNDIEGIDKPAYGTSNDIVMKDDGASEKAVRRVSKVNSSPPPMTRETSGPPTLSTPPCDCRYSPCAALRAAG